MLLSLSAVKAPCCWGSRQRARRTPSHNRAQWPLGWTSIKRTIQSVSRAEVAANSVARIGPVTSTTSSRGGVEYTSTSLRVAPLRDTDWMVRLIDVHPNGHCALLCDGVL